MPCLGRSIWEQLSWGHRRPCPAPEATILKASWRQRQRAQSSLPPNPLPLWCQLALRCKGQRAHEGLRAGSPTGRVEGDGRARAAGEMDRTRGGGQRKKQTEQRLGGNSDLGLQNPLQGIPGTLLHQEDAGPRDVRGQAGPGHIPQPTVGLAAASHSLLTAHSTVTAEHCWKRKDPPKLSSKSHSQVLSPHRASFLFACLSNPIASVQPKGSQPVRTGLGAPPHPANKMWESGHT